MEQKITSVDKNSIGEELGIRPGDDLYIVNELGVGYRMQQGEEE